MSEEYRIRYPDGSEVGPFDQATIDEMTQADEIPEDAQIIQITNESQAALQSYLIQLKDKGIHYSELEADDRIELERHFSKLMGRPLSFWSNEEKKIFEMIVSIPGRKEFFESYSASLDSLSLRAISRKLDVLMAQNMRIEAALLKPTSSPNSDELARTLQDIASSTRVTAFKHMHDFIDEYT